MFKLYQISKKRPPRANPERLIVALDSGLCTRNIAMLLFFLSTTVMAQNQPVSGRVSDEKGEALVGANVIAKGTNIGTQTDAAGAFTFSVPAATTTLVISSIGYATLEVPTSSSTMTISLKASDLSLAEVIVTGYGEVKKTDLTGSIVAVQAKDFQKGQISSPEQLIAGKVAGVQITSAGGAPGAPINIKVRGGTSLNASNSPLIVIDGLPLDNNGITGAANPLSLINPNDIESFNVLKDASATAIYGSRAANGVIIITTKKGKAGSALSVAISSLNTVSTKTHNLDMLSGEEYRNLVKTSPLATDQQRLLLGTANTNWQDQIYRTAFTSDNNISISGGISWLPYRLSYGNLSQQGILKRNSLKRNSVNLNLSPKFLGNHLAVTINAKFANIKNNFSSQGAIGTAVRFDPTQPIYSDNSAYGGYFEYTSGGALATNAPRNPLGLIYSSDNTSTVNRFIGSALFDYSFHFLPALHANLNLGTDIAHGEGLIYAPATSSAYIANRKSGGINTQSEQTKKNKLLELYFNYGKDLKSINSHIDLLAGYSYQDFLSRSPAYPDLAANQKDTVTVAGIPGFGQNTLVSFYGRVNYHLEDRYLLTVTLRRDGSSRFGPDSRWGNFPSAALAWKVSDEPFLKASPVISNLKMRLSWGITGQQDGIADFSYQPTYAYGDNSSQYQFGSTFVTIARPQAYDANLKWEQTETKNIGVDLGLINNRLTMSLDYYDKYTKDLLAVVPVPAGTNFINQLLTNVGAIRNRGLELTLGTNINNGKDFSLNLSFNATAILRNTIERLQLVNDPSFTGTEVGFVNFNFVAKNAVGYRPNTFYMYKQLYDDSGKPLEGKYQDTNGDGVISADDKQLMRSPDPKFYLGFSANSTYRKWNAGFTLRANLGNYLYNFIRENSSSFNKVTGQGPYINNVTPDILATNFANEQPWSDRYMENASFLRMDNLFVAYEVGRVFKGKVDMRLSASCQNVFVVTKYTGIDPEQIGTAISYGIDQSIYPRSRNFSLGINLGF